MKCISLFLTAFALMIISANPLDAQNPQEPKTPADLHKLADDYYNWRNQNYPVFSSDAGLHTWDHKLTDYSLSALLARRLHVKEVLGTVRAMQTKGWTKDDRIDWLLFPAQLENVAF